MDSPVVSATPRLLIEGLTLPEGPRWHGGRLWISDMFAGRVLSVSLDGRVDTVVETAGKVSGLGWLPDGRLLLVSMLDRRLLRLDPGGVVEVADLATMATFHCNDMVVDGTGRAYVGNFGFDWMHGAPFVGATLALVDPDGTVRAAARDLIYPNGMVITPDGRTLIVAESAADRLTAFHIAPDGTLVGRRLWASVDGPDGICLDAEGAVWVASPRLGQVQRFLPGCEVSHRLSTTLAPYACMLGGADRRLLFVCQAPKPEELVSAPPGTFRHGRVEYLEVAVPGAGLP